MLSIEHLYGEVDNLTGLVHPEWARGFAYMGDAAVIELAQELARAIVRSGMTTALVSETGASPFAEVCQMVLAYTGHKVQFHSVKFPRDPLSSIFPVLASFLTAEEKTVRLSPARKELLKNNSIAGALPLSEAVDRLQTLRLITALMPSDFFVTGKADVARLLATIGNEEQTPFQHAISIVFEDTEFANVLAQPFIYLDEYIDSGTTLRNAIAFFRCFLARPLFQTASYYINLPGNKATNEQKRTAARSTQTVESGSEADRDGNWNSSPGPNVLYTRYTTTDKPHCFDNGAYPYENRVDLIGHFYRIDSSDYVRTSLTSIDSAFPLADSENCLPLLQALAAAVEEERLFAAVSQRFSLEAVRNFITVEHVIRHCLFQLERATGTPDYAEFLFQLFDMYGPAWTPMPVSFHFDFWKGFEYLDQAFSQVPQWGALTVDYRQCRESLLGRSAQICLSRRRVWLAQIETQLEDIHGHSKSISASRTGADDGLCLGKSR